MNKPTHVRYLVMAWMCLFAMIAYLQRGCLAVPAQLIREDLGLSKDEMGWAMSMFLWGYALMQLPGGWFGDRWGSRRALPILMLASSLATGLSALSCSLGMLLFCRALMGAAQAGLFPCAVLSFSKWFPATERAFPNGMLASFMSVGGVAGAALTGAMLNLFTWREIFFLFSLPGLLCLWFYAWFRDRPGAHGSVNADERLLIEGAVANVPVEPPQPVPWARLATDTRMWLIGGQQFFRAAGYIFYMTWFPTFLKENHQVNDETAGYLSALPLLGVVIGSAVGGLFMDWLYRRTGSKNISRKGVALVSLTACAALVASAYWIEDALPRTLWLSASSVFAGLCGPAAYTATIDFGGKHVATVFSVMNMAGNVGAALLPVVTVQFEKLVNAWVRPVTPFLRDMQVAPRNAPTGVGGVNEVLFLLAGLYVAAALCWVFLRMDGGAISERRDSAHVC